MKLEVKKIPDPLIPLRADRICIGFTQPTQNLSSKFLLVYIHIKGLGFWYSCAHTQKPKSFSLCSFL